MQPPTRCCQSTFLKAIIASTAFPARARLDIFEHSATLPAQHLSGERTVKKFLTLLFVMFSITTANFAQAGQVVTYTFTGTADGNVGATSFTAQTYTFSVTGDSAAVQNSSYPYSNVLTGGTITINGTACAGGCTITNPSNYLVFNTSIINSLVHGISLVGNIDVSGSTLIEGCFVTDCGGTQVNDNLVTVVSPTASGDENALAPYLTFATGGGNVQLTNLDSHITYSVSLASPATIPTLSQYGLMLLALMIAGTGYWVQRRRTV